MATIAVLIDELFEDSEYEQPALAFKQSGHQLVHLGPEAGKRVTGKGSGLSVVIDKSVEKVNIADFDALLIPGGYSPDKLRVHLPVVQFTREFVASGKPIFTICHGPQLLITADVLRGRRITGYKSIIQDIKNAGAEFVDQEVVQDANIISSRNPDDLPAFIKQSLEVLL